jgi:hypothetical protein
MVTCRWWILIIVRWLGLSVAIVVVNLWLGFTVALCNHGGLGYKSNSGKCE